MVGRHEDRTSIPGTIPTSLASGLYQSLDPRFGQIFPRTVGRIWQSSWRVRFAVVEAASVTADFSLG
jgi:hypothetical protein